MKKLSVCLSLLLLLVFVANTCMAASRVSADGSFKGIKLYGKVKIVTYGADIKVKVVTSFPDLKVKVVEHFPDSVGKWQFVEYGEDFKIQFVTSFEDISIKYVESFPGV